MVAEAPPPTLGFLPAAEPPVAMETASGLEGAAPGPGEAPPPPGAGAGPTPWAGRCGPRPLWVRCTWQEGPGLDACGGRGGCPRGAGGGAESEVCARSLAQHRLRAGPDATLPTSLSLRRERGGVGLH